MAHFLSLLSLLTASGLVASSNVERAAADFDPWNSCTPCFRSSWTQGPECATDIYIASVESLITNPPASVTATYTASKFCSDYLRQTDYSSVYTTSSGISTYTSWFQTFIGATETDTDHPTATMYCPMPSQGMTCGIDNPNIVAPEDQQEDWSIEHWVDPEQCLQTCLERDYCKAYRITGNAVDGWYCENFGLGLGVNGSNVISASAGTVWWDRNCQVHLPTGCTSSALPPATLTAAARTAPSTFQTIQASQPTPLLHRAAAAAPSPAITAAPTLLPRNDIKKRDTPIPSFLAELEYVYSVPFLVAACSCYISSGLPVLTSTVTITRTEWTGSTTVSVTDSDYFTVTVTPRSTTLYSSIM